MTTSRTFFRLAGLLLLLDLNGSARAADDPDLILHHGKIVTVDRDFSIREAVSIKGDRLIQVGTNDDVLSLRGPNTTLKTTSLARWFAGLIDSHTHPTGACMTEFDHPVPDMETIQDVLDYIHSRAEALGPERWVVVRQVFITRLKEQRYPTSRRAGSGRAPQPRPVLDRPRCVGQLAGPQTQRHSTRIFRSMDDRDRSRRIRGRASRPGSSGNCTRYVSVSPAEHGAATELKIRSGGWPSFSRDSATRSGSRPSSIATPTHRPLDRYQENARGRAALTVRLGISHHVETLGPLDKVLEEIRRVAALPRLPVVGPELRDDHSGHPRPIAGWRHAHGRPACARALGVSRLYAIDDPSHRGVLFIPRDEARHRSWNEAVASGLQFTAHSVGDGAVHAAARRLRRDQQAHEQAAADAPVHHALGTS